jgi:hypothetical protein
MSYAISIANFKENQQYDLKQYYSNDSRTVHMFATLQPILSITCCSTIIHTWLTHGNIS